MGESTRGGEGYFLNPRSGLFQEMRWEDAPSSSLDRYFSSLECEDQTRVGGLRLKLSQLGRASVERPLSNVPFAIGTISFMVGSFSNLRLALHY